MVREHIPENVVENDEVKLLWDFTIQSDREMMMMMIMMIMMMIMLMMMMIMLMMMMMMMLMMMMMMMIMLMIMLMVMMTMILIVTKMMIERETSQQEYRSFMHFCHYLSTANSSCR